MNRAFSAGGRLWGNEPRAFCWAGMNDAFGVSTASAEQPWSRVEDRSFPFDTLIPYE
jgi:hypothetical protein